MLARSSYTFSSPHTANSTIRKTHLINIAIYHPSQSSEKICIFMCVPHEFFKSPERIQANPVNSSVLGHWIAEHKQASKSKEATMSMLHWFRATLHCSLSLSRPTSIFLLHHDNIYYPILGFPKAPDELSRQYINLGYTPSDNGAASSTNSIVLIQSRKYPVSVII